MKLSGNDDVLEISSEGLDEGALINIDGDSGEWVADDAHQVPGLEAVSAEMHQWFEFVGGAIVYKPREKEEKEEKEEIDPM